MSPLDCDYPCHCMTGSEPTRFVVITGGPGAGKTVVLESLKKTVCSQVAVLPEAASILFGGGFWRLESKTALRAAQLAIFHVQRQSESLVKNEGRWSLGLCDRGSLDGLAYWPEDESAFYQTIRSDLQSEFNRYDAVIHLQTPSEKNGYQQSAIRLESAQRAADIDRRIHEIWKNHPKYFVIESTPNFLAKVALAVSIIQHFLPASCDFKSRSELNMHPKS